MSVEEKREFVYQIAKWPQGAPAVLQSWSRQEILQILCLEMGKERKYTGLTKLKMIEHLLKIVCEKQSGESEEADNNSSQDPRSSKRQRKSDNPSRLSVSTSSTQTVKTEIDSEKSVYCKNTACKASLSREDKFCKRCSCCICYKYDDNKDPSLWLICNSEPPFQGDSCGMSCHLDCALKNERSRIARGGQRGGVDGSFCCVSCGKVNDILGCWRKQLMIAKDTRRVDILCYRLALTKKLTSGTEKYSEINGIVEEAVKKLEAEVGPLSGLPVKMGRGIVNRLSSGPAVQKLCASAVELLDFMLSSLASPQSPESISPGTMPYFLTIRPDAWIRSWHFWNIVKASDDSVLAPENLLKFENIGPTSITVILGSEDPPSGSSMLYSLWHRGADESDYSLRATCTLSTPNRKFTVSGLTPSSEYFFRAVVSDGKKELGSFEISSSTSSSSANELSNQIVVERSQSPATNCSSLSNPSSVEDETNNMAPCSNQNGIEAGDYQLVASCPGFGEGQSLPEACPLGARAIVPMIPDSEALNQENKDKTAEETSTDDGSGKECVPFAGSSEEASLPITPCKAENNNSKDESGRTCRTKPCGNLDIENEIGFGSTMKKRRRESGPINNDGQSPDRDFEFYVKLIRWLECKGHIEKNFRQKFLTWYTLKATPQEVRIVKVFVDTFIEDPASLAEQLMDTFSDCISSKESSSVVPSGICMKLWH
ncbi:VIN3-like protein 2 isoform X2 [Punica granatum]|nr:VIN3-like protein 2 isoform X2 [Punica granatum]